MSPDPSHRHDATSAAGARASITARPGGHFASSRWSFGAPVACVLSIATGGVAISRALEGGGFWMLCLSIGLVIAAARMTPDYQSGGGTPTEPARLRPVTVVGSAQGRSGSSPRA